MRVVAAAGSGSPLESSPVAIFCSTVPMASSDVSLYLRTSSVVMCICNEYRAVASWTGSENNVLRDDLRVATEEKAPEILAGSSFLRP